MIIGQNYLNIDMTARGLYRVVTGDGEEMSGLFPYADIHAICYAVCIKEDSLYREFDYVGGILAEVPGDYIVYLSFFDGCYHARPTNYKPNWFEIQIGTIEEITKWVQLIC